MKRIFYFLGLILSIAAFSCTKDDIITSGDALLRTSTDTLHYDTVFTATGSVTKFFMIHNDNDARLKLSNVQLMGGSSSPFKINVDGAAGTSFNNIEIAKGDSIYVFVKVTINPTVANLPFVITDSIKIDYNGNTRFVQLDAFGQNANFLRNASIINDTTWTSIKPIVILGGFNVSQNKTLNISAGTKVYFHADAPLVVNGSLKVNGTAGNHAVFTGDRLDVPYRNFPASWPGIVFGPVSTDNILQYTTIKNAYQGAVVLQPSLNANAKLTLAQCIIDNTYDIALLGTNSSINATNCLITNAARNVVLQGGNYTFNHCTVASFSNIFLRHKSPVLSVSNTDGTSINNLSAIFTNSIFYGEGDNLDDEIAVTKQGTSTFNVAFNRILYKVKNADPANATFTASVKNQNPLFFLIDNGNLVYDFHLKDGSPAINTGIATTATVDLEGNPRNVATPDIGAYERQ